MEKCCNHKSKHGRNLLVGLVVVGVLAGVAVLANGCHRGHGHFKDPAKIRKVVQWKVDDVLDDIGANDAQRRQIEATADELVTDGLKLRDDRQQRHAQIVAELRKPQPDAKALHAMLDQRADVIRAFAHRSVDRMLAAYQVLDENQRLVLLDQIEEHFDAHR